MTAVRVTPNAPLPMLPDDLRARFDLHEAGRLHAICCACSRGIAWTSRDLKSGAWLAILREHVCAVRS